MNRRLQQFLDLEQLSPARLADILGIQRSGISHILSGRNKPSYDFITRFLAKFPNINPEWLLLGKGKPYKEINSDNTSESEKETTDDYSNQSIELEEDNGDNTLLYPSENPQKTINRITLFYSDGSFEEFYPPKLHK